MRAEADGLLWVENYGAGRDLLLATIRFFEGLPQDIQRDQEMMATRAASFRFLGEAHHELEETEQAQRALDEAVSMNKAIAARRPDDPLLRRRIVTSSRYRAVVHRANDRHELARQSIEEALHHARWLRDRDPNDVGAIQQHAAVNEVNGLILGDLGRFSDAYAAIEEALAAHKIMVERAGNAPGALRSFAQALRISAALRYNGRDHGAACRQWQELVGLFGEMERRGALTARDRDNTLRETRERLPRACNPPRAGLGPTL
jgi:tetratricopeptide (TPR) repeat protein